MSLIYWIICLSKIWVSHSGADKDSSLLEYEIERSSFIDTAIGQNFIILIVNEWKGHIKHLLGWYFQENHNTVWKTFLNITSSTANPSWNDLGFNLGHVSDRLTAYYLSWDMMLCGQVYDIQSPIFRKTGVFKNFDSLKFINLLYTVWNEVHTVKHKMKAFNHNTFFKITITTYIISLYLSAPASGHP